MRTLLGIALSLVLFFAANSTDAQTPVHIWDHHYGQTQPLSGQMHIGVLTTDASRNVIAAGAFHGKVSLGGAALVSPGYLSYTETDGFLAKYDMAGNHLWSKNFGSAGNDSCTAVAVDPSGNILVVGVLADSVNFGGGKIDCPGHHGMFIAKLSTSGTHLWSKAIGDGRPIVPMDISSDGSGNVLVTGWFAGTVNFGGGALISAGGSLNNLGDVFVAKYNASGVHQWSKRYGTEADDGGYGIEADAFGNVIISGDIQTPIDFGGGPVGPTDTAAMYLVKLSPSGAHIWSKGFGDPYGYMARNLLSVDAAGNSYLTGIFQGDVDLGGGNLHGPDYDMYLAKFNSSGTHQWSRALIMDGYVTNAVVPETIDTDSNGNVVFAGLYTGSIDLGAGTHTAPGPVDAFIAKYTAAGMHRWSRVLSCSYAADAGGVAVDADQNVVVSGVFRGGADFGAGTVLSSGSGASSDLFVAKYAPESVEPFISSIVDVPNDQGHRVNIRFDRSGNDATGSSSQIVNYEAYRRDDAPPSAISARGLDQLSRERLLDLGWTFVGQAPAHGKVSYALEAPTIGDSTITLGAYYSTFFVRAATANPLVFYDSPIDSGYSVDNLAPAVPQNLVFAGGNLTWDESSAEDFKFSTVYGSNVDLFGSATVVDYTTDEAMDVSASPYAYYFVTATDFSGNEGKAAKVNTLSGVGGTPQSYVLSVSNYPNPFNPRTTVRYTVPERGHVTVAIYDTRGAHVATLFDGERSAGAYTMDWNGVDDRGANVSSGVYFSRIEQHGVTRTKKMVLLK